MHNLPIGKDMKYYFLKSADKTHAAEFRQKMIRHNTASTRALSLTLVLLSSSIYLGTHLINYFNVFPEPVVSHVNLKVIVFSLTTYLSIGLLKRSKYRNNYRLFWAIANLYAVILISRCIWLSFEIQHNPANTMSMFLLGTFAAGILWLFTAVETFLISLAMMGVFLIGLPYFQVDPGKIWENIIVATCIITVFFCISRIIFSYHYNYYVQLKTVEKKNYEISRMDRNKTEMLGIVAHDLRSPISSITALVELARNYQVSEEERQQYYELIQQACRETEETVNDLIEVAKGQEEALITAETDMSSFLNDIQQQWAHRMLGGRQLQLFSNDEKLFAHIHAQKMQRVLDNLINNAIKFTREDGVICIELSARNDRLQLSVRDNGIGIPEELYPYLFDRFSKAGRNGLNGEKSHGLGLSICKQIIEQHNGVIYVNSKVNNGTTFSIDLPLRSAAVGTS